MSPAHPAAGAFPWLPEAELQALADDIAANGQQYKIVRLPDGRVVDGRNRELACLVAGEEPQYADQDMGEDDVVRLVLSRNVHRRHLDASQRAMAAAELANLSRGRPEINPSQDGLNGEVNISQAVAATQLDVSAKSVERAAAVKKKAPELVEAVKEGKLDVRTAAKVADLPKRKREKVAQADDPKAAAKEVLRREEGAVTRPDEPVGSESAGGEADGFVAAVESLCRDVDQIAARMKSLKSSRYAYSINVDSSVAQVEAARKTLWQGRPAHVCPYCKGEGCKTCAQTGRVKRSTYDSGREAIGGAE